MNRYLVEFRMKDDADFDMRKASDDAFIASGSVYVFADSITDAAWNVTFAVGSHLEVSSVKRD